MYIVSTIANMKNERIQIRVESKFKKSLQKEASLQDETLSGYVMRILREALGLNKKTGGK